MNHRHVGLLILAIGIAPLSIAQIETPDLNKENSFYELYKNYNSVPTDINSWSSATKGKSEKYEINSQDTLWDVSEVLFGDPNFWPKIWSLNAEKIENPHQIFPNQMVKFNMGTLSEPPTLEVQKPGEETVTTPLDPLSESKPPEPAPMQVIQKTSEAVEDGSVAAEADADDSPAGPLDAKSKEILSLANIPPESKDGKRSGKIPPSLPKWVFAPRIPKLDLDVKRLNRVPPPPEEPLKFFVATEETAGVGKVLSGEGDQLTAGDYQYVNVQIDPDVPGNKFYAIAERGQIKDPVSGEKAIVYQLEGEVDRLEVINSAQNIYRGFVQKVVVPINMGSIVVAGDFPKYRAQVSEITSGKAWLIGGEQDIKRNLLYVNSLVYLAGDGISEGVTYPVYRKQSIRVDKSLEIENPRRIGAVKIIKTSGRFATGVLVEASEDVRVGDVTDPSLISIE